MQKYIFTSGSPVFNEIGYVLICSEDGVSRDIAELIVRPEDYFSKKACGKIIVTVIDEIKIKRGYIYGCLYEDCIIIGEHYESETVSWIKSRKRPNLKNKIIFTVDKKEDENTMLVESEQIYKVHILGQGFEWNYEIANDPEFPEESILISHYEEGKVCDKVSINKSCLKAVADAIQLKDKELND